MAAAGKVTQMAVGGKRDGDGGQTRTDQILDDVVS